MPALCRYEGGGRTTQYKSKPQALLWQSSLQAAAREGVMIPVVTVAAGTDIRRDPNNWRMRVSSGR
jgi:hypothetical protein